MAKNNHEPDTNGINIVGVGTEISGDIVSNGDIRVDGSLNGKLNTKGKVVVGVTGKVKGEICCKNSDVEGYIEGKITVLQLLSLKATAQINGDIIVSRLAIEPGCKFTGTCDMKAETLSNEEKHKIGKQEKQPVKSE
jgi:cytoskeletal protein CcmA (bactofilin family)